MILEGIVTSSDVDNAVHVAPMGPDVDQQLQTLTLRPYATSNTFANLKRTGYGVFHVTDDVEFLARAAVGRLKEPIPLATIPDVRGHVLAGACRWYAFDVATVDESLPRVVMHCTVVASGRLRDFFGFNRAKHAVVEAAILATRVGILPATDIDEQLTRLAMLVDKTGGDQEHRAFDFLVQYLAKHRS